jgi:hypothetical protein
MDRTSTRPLLLPPPPLLLLLLLLPLLLPPLLLAAADDIIEEALPLAEQVAALEASGRRFPDRFGLFQEGEAFLRFFRFFSNFFRFFFIFFPSSSDFFGVFCVCFVLFLYLFWFVLVISSFSEFSTETRGDARTALLVCCCRGAVRPCVPLVDCFSFFFWRSLAAFQALAVFLVSSRLVSLFSRLVSSLSSLVSLFSLLSSRLVSSRLVSLVSPRLVSSRLSLFSLSSLVSLASLAFLVAPSPLSSRSSTLVAVGGSARREKGWRD